MTEISNCCRFHITYIAGDEGTEYMRCDKCDKPCDYYVSPIVECEVCGRAFCSEHKPQGNFNARDTDVPTMEDRFETRFKPGRDRVPYYILEEEALEFAKDEISLSLPRSQEKDRGAIKNRTATRI